MRYIFGIKCILVLLLTVLGTGSAHAYTVSCVSNAVQLNAALQHARNASDTTVIELVQGTYDLSGTFLTTASANDVLVQFNAIKLLGGYDSTCTNRSLNPENTVFDGGGPCTPAAAHTTARGVARGFFAERGIGFPPRRKTGGAAWNGPMSAGDLPTPARVTLTLPRSTDESH